MDLELIKSYYFAFLLGLPRMYAAFTVMSFLSKQVLTGTVIRNGFAISLGIFILPILDVNIQGFEQLQPPQMALILAKEVAIGYLVGYAANIPFWAMTAIGEFIDNHRGATIMESLNFITNSQGSPLGNLMTQAAVTIFLTSGAFLVFFKGLVISYSAWPVQTFMPVFDIKLVNFMVAQFQFMAEVILLLGGPIIIALFLGEVGLALISRFAPQLNVFILALSVKSALALAILVVYFSIIIGYFEGMLIDIDLVFDKVSGKLK